MNYGWLLEQKKCGAESSDPNRHSQPRLPGSVVGEASMRQRAEAGKITKVSAPVITSACSSELRAMSSMISACFAYFMKHLRAGLLEAHSSTLAAISW
jgi:hypothetical protein